MIRFSAFFLLTLFLTGCQSPKTAITNMNQKGALLPRVALAPIFIQDDSNAKIDHAQIVEEASEHLLCSLLKQQDMQLSGPKWLEEQKRVPITSLWHSHDLQPASLLLPHDFIILIEIKRFELKETQLKNDFNQTTKRFSSIKPFYYDVQVYVRVINMTTQVFTLAMQEHFMWNIPVSKAQVLSDEAVQDWNHVLFNGTGIAATLLPVCKEITARCQQRIHLAWMKRVPYSRLEKATL